MGKIKISAVSYANTFPFLYGMEHSDYLRENTELTLAYPKQSADLLLNKQVDVALLPVGVIPQLKISYIVSKYCIGAEGPVRSVILASRVPKEQIKEIYLDYQSATSVRLIQILCKYYWHISPAFRSSMPGYERSINSTTAGVIIGDRTFVNNDYEYIYDLAKEWEDFTSMPFVFAVWLAVKPLSPEFKEELNKALGYGVENIPSVIKTFQSKMVAGFNAEEYYTKNISYYLTPEKSKGMNTFLKYLRLEKGLMG